MDREWKAVLVQSTVICELPRDDGEETVKTADARFTRTSDTVDMFGSWQKGPAVQLMTNLPATAIEM